MKKPLVIILLLTALAVTFVIFKDKLGLQHNQHGMSHAGHSSMGHKLPVEVGDAGFAAIAEIVTLLSNDPNTDWNQVNINGLREHLVLMSQLVQGAAVEEESIPNGRRFRVSGEGLVLKAIQQMVPAHSAELNKMDEFSASATLADDGAVLEISGRDEAVTAKFKGLGFFGLMATGSHHQMHHLMMATGKGHH